MSVVHADAVLADAWATALTVLGPEAGLERAEALGLAAYLIARGPEGRYEVHATEGFPAVAVPRAGEPGEDDPSSED